MYVRAHNAINKQLLKIVSHEGVNERQAILITSFKLKASGVPALTRENSELLERGKLSMVYAS